MTDPPNPYTLPLRSPVGAKEEIPFRRFATQRVLNAWRELVVASSVVALVVTPPDVVSMLIAIPPILAGMVAVYIHALWTCRSSAQESDD